VAGEDIDGAVRSDRREQGIRLTLKPTPEKQLAPATGVELGPMHDQ
jgi:hypothetical protein